MKVLKSKLGFLVAALLGVSTAAQSQVQGVADRFIPLENLSPETRAQYEKQLVELEGNPTIHWDSVVAGINESGVLILKDRDSYNLDIVSSPSCWPVQ